jgi:signal peptidase II
VTRSWRSIPAVLALATLVGCDHATKIVAKTELEHHAPRHLLGSLLDVRYVENTDVAFNALRWIPESVRSPLLIVFGAVAILCVLILLQRTDGAATRVSLVLILAGALGNYADRLTRGYVVDFIHVPHWPVFNVADICLTAGVILLCWTKVGSRRVEPSAGAG